MKLEAGGRVYDVSDPTQARAFLAAQQADIERENRTPLWERVLLLVVLVLLGLVIVSAILSVAGVHR